MRDLGTVARSGSKAFLEQLAGQGGGQGRCRSSGSSASASTARTSWPTGSRSCRARPGRRGVALAERRQGDVHVEPGREPSADVGHAPPARGPEGVPRRLAAAASSSRATRTTSSHPIRCVQEHAAEQRRDVNRRARSGSARRARSPTSSTTSSTSTSRTTTRRRSRGRTSGRGDAGVRRRCSSSRARRPSISTSGRKRRGVRLFVRARLHHGRLRGARARVAALRARRRRLGRPAAQRVARGPAGLGRGARHQEAAR